MEESTKIAEFCNTALTLLEVNISEETSGVVCAKIPSSRLDLFDGRTELHMAFDPAQASDDVELVVPGSYVLEKLLEIVRQRGSLNRIYLSPAVKSPAPPRIDLRNAEARLVSSDTYFQPILLCNFKVSMVSDEDEDRVHTAAVDLETGEMLDPAKIALNSSSTQQPPSTATDRNGTDLSSGFSLVRNSAHDFAVKWASSLQATVDQRLAAEVSRLDGYYKDLLSDSTVRQKTDIKKVQSRRDRVASEVAKECKEIKKNYNAAKRLLAMVKTGDELDKLINDTSEKIHKLKFSLTLNYHAEMSPLQATQVLIDQSADIIRSIVSTVPAEKQTEELENRRQQAISDSQKRLDEQSQTQSELESKDQLNAISARMDAEKNQRIEELKDKFQIKMVVTPISTGLINYPKARFTFEAISGNTSIPFTTAHDLVTDQVQLPVCACCGSEMSSTYACSCGHLACTECQKSCIVCGTFVCSSCVKTSCQVCGGMLCERCEGKCESCGKVICPTHSTKCKECGRTVCKGSEVATCSRTCAVCGDDFCSKHAEDCPICHSTVCLDSIKKCTVCGIKGCVIDVTPCGSCGKPVCPTHGSPCKICGQPMCRECIGLSGYCSTCDNLFPATISLPALQQIVSQAAATNSSGGSWLIGESDRHFVLVRKGMRIRIYLIDKRSGRLCAQRRLGFWQSMKCNLRD